MEMENIEFEKGKMLKLIQKGLLLQKMYRELGNDEQSLEIPFNSEVLGDSIMINEYLNS